jgi:hypothetical protein
MISLRNMKHAIFRVHVIMILMNAYPAFQVFGFALPFKPNHQSLVLICITRFKESQGLNGKEVDKDLSIQNIDGNIQRSY